MTLNEIYRAAKENGQADICRFMRDMRRAGLRMRPYDGRCYRKGPAVVVGHPDEVRSATRIPVQFDGMGLDVIVYPRESLRGVKSV